jgi:hypothetical protein
MNWFFLAATGPTSLRAQRPAAARQAADVPDRKVRCAVRLFASSALVFAVATALAAGLFFVGWGSAERYFESLDRGRFFHESDEQRRGQELDMARDVVLRRVAAKVGIAGEVIRGDIDLREAVSRFRELIDSDPRAVVILHSVHPDLSDDDVYWQNVIDFVRCELSDCHADAESRRARLEAELRGYLRDRSINRTD